MVKKTDSKIVDLYDGEVISCWKDEAFVYIALPFLTLSILHEDVAEYKHDLLELTKKL